jgi:hypothetical protein
MHDRTTLDRILRLHRASYDLLRWVSKSLDSGGLSFATVHRNMGAGDAAADWLTQNYGSLPPACRPALEDLRPFGFLLASYLSTSFELPSRPVPYLVTSCCCDCCGYLASGRRLVVRTPSAKDVGQAHRLKAIWLKELAEESGVAFDTEVEGAFFSDRQRSHELAFVAYAAELVRRSEFASQGHGVLALWRSIAWKDGHPIKRFELTTGRVLEAQQATIHGLRTAAGL